MHCPKCGRPASSGADRCTSCDTGFSTAGSTGDTATGALGEFSNDATATAARPADPDATVLGTARQTDPDETRIEASPLSETQAYFAADTAVPRPPSAARAFTEHAEDLVGRSLGTRYQIIKLLGAGGMGAVYQAWDADLSVVVALKTVRPEVTADPESTRQLERRFKQELLLARQVTHKNIVRVHDMGEVEGIKYITMPYIEGEDLATILKRDGKLPVERVMPIARQVISGLVAAHAAGVVHRDLKPANIMVQAGGEPLITDFGVARSTSATEAAAGSPALGAIRGGQTVAGTVVGSVPYMAPEQARAQPVDQRADIYAFGLILYDLLLGARRGKSVEGGMLGELTQRMQQAPPSPRSIDPAIPEPLDALITKCLQPDPAQRPQTSADVVAMFERLDDRGRKIHLARRLTWKMGAAAAAVVVALVGGTWWFSRGPAPEVKREPVSVVIADFQNATGDASLDGTLEPVMQLALEGASFITAYDRAGLRRVLSVRPPPKMDEPTTVELALKHGVNVVLAGAISQQGNRFEVSMKAIRAVTGEVIKTTSEHAARKADILGAATKAAFTVRTALGDNPSDTAQRFAMETLSSRSIEAVREYAKGMEALSRSQFEDALKAFQQAVTLDPTFGTAYGAMAMTSRNRDNLTDAVTYANEAMKYLSGMTEREAFRARGHYYFLTNDFEKCVKEYGDLLAQWSGPGDAAARNNRALCLTSLRQLGKAIDEMKELVRQVPGKALYQDNLALYLAYNGEYPAAEDQVKAMTDPGLFALLGRAYAELGQGRLADAARTYQSLPVADKEDGPSYMVAGLADLAIHDGRYADAAKQLSQAAAAHEKSGVPGSADKAATKYVALAYANLLRGQKPAAVAAAQKALTNSQAVKIRFLAARVMIEAGAAPRAEKIVASLSEELQAEPQAYASHLEGLRAMAAGNPRQAAKSLEAATAQFDTWIGHFDLGRAYLASRAYAQADIELDRCVKRKGEALSLFLDEQPTFGYFPAVYYYLGQAREGMKNPAFADSYRDYLQVRGKSTEDALAADARKRLAQK